MTDTILARPPDPRRVLAGSSPAAPAEDHSEGMSYLHSLPRRLVTLY